MLQESKCTCQSVIQLLTLQLTERITEWSVSSKTSKSYLHCRWRAVGVTWLKNSVINYSPTILNAMNIVGSVAGGSGNLFVFLLQRKYRFATKKGVCYGAFMTLLP